MWWRGIEAARGKRRDSVSWSRARNKWEERLGKQADHRRSDYHPSFGPEYPSLDETPRPTCLRCGSHLTAGKLTGSEKAQGHRPEMTGPQLSASDGSEARLSRAGGQVAVSDGRTGWFCESVAGCENGRHATHRIVDAATGTVGWLPGSQRLPRSQPNCLCCKEGQDRALEPCRTGTGSESDRDRTNRRPRCAGRAAWRMRETSRSDECCLRASLLLPLPSLRLHALGYRCQCS